MRHSAFPPLRLRRQLAAALLVGLLFFNQFAAAFSGPMKMPLSSHPHSGMTMVMTMVDMAGAVSAHANITQTTGFPCHHEQPASSCHGAACCLCHLSPALALTSLHPTIIAATLLASKILLIYDSLMASEQLRPPAILLV